jgi:hypothetical protein
MQSDECGHPLVRVRRRKWERLLYSKVFLCPLCERKTRVAKVPAPCFSLHRKCPKCGGANLERLPRRDEIDPLYRNPVSLVQALIGASIWWCPDCRLQFYDVRPAVPVRQPPHLPLP